MKQKKIKLSELKIQSFVTQLDTHRAYTAKGGATGFGCDASIKIACLSQGAQICSDDSC